MKLTTLYKKNLDKSTSYITLSTRKVKGTDTYEMVTTTGLHGKKDSERESVILVDTGKNIGKKNETTPKQQAESELRSKHAKLAYEGYSEWSAKVLESTYNTFPDESPMPMLLNKYSSKEFVACYMQRKYDGVRCKAEKVKDEVNKFRLMSREGKVFDIQHILDQYITLSNRHVECTPDGELYKHHEALSDIVSAVKNGDPKSELNYVIYDVLIPDMPFEKRRTILLAIKNAAEESGLTSLIVDEGTWVSTQEEMDAFHNESIRLGYEGSIVCKADGMYQFGFRTSDKSKIKPRMTEEFTCVSHYYNKGKMSKQSTLICKNSDGREFHVKLKGTSEQREQWAENFDTQFKDKPVTVEFRKLSKFGVPMEAVGLVVRDYETNG